MNDPVEIVDIGLTDLSWAEFIKSRALYSFTSSSITERLEFLNHSLIPTNKSWRSVRIKHLEATLPSVPYLLQDIMTDLRVPQ
ncbi:unnamed protein product [Rhizophagus irregularis]|nr:unnamed protein product [Rhizophagus irregularis]